jgi:hypothetical protein
MNLDWRQSHRSFVLRIRITFDLSSPSKEAEKLLFLRPEQVPEVSRTHRLCAPAGVSFESPSKVRAPPRSQPVAACRIPKKSEFFAHIDHHNRNLRAKTSITFVHGRLLSHEAKEILAPESIDYTQECLVLGFGRR